MNEQQALKAIEILSTAVDDLTTLGVNSLTGTTQTTNQALKMASKLRGMIDDVRSPFKESSN